MTKGKGKRLVRCVPFLEYLFPPSHALRHLVPSVLFFLALGLWAGSYFSFAINTLQLKDESR